MEIFTFMRMGGEMERITLKLIARPDQDQADAREELTAQLATFDAGEAQCFKQADRQKLLAVIEAAYGDFKKFNKGVRHVFAERARRPSDNPLQPGREISVTTGEDSKTTAAAAPAPATPMMGQKQNRV